MDKWYNATMSFMMVTWWSCAFSAYPETALLSWLGRGFIKRKPGQARTVEVLIPPEQLPPLE
jgi:hypothetical protein